MEMLTRNNSFRTEIQRSLPNIPEICEIGRWDFLGKSVTLIKEQDTIKYYIQTDGIAKIEGQIRADLLRLYGMPRSLRLIDIFKNVIQENLKKELITDRAFLPILLTEGFIENRSDDKVVYKPLKNIHIALFGQMTKVPNKIFGANWGVFNFVGKKSYYIQIEHTDIDSKLALALINSFEEKEYDSLEQKIALIRKFKPIVTLDSDGRVSRIVLHRFSEMDSEKIIPNGSRAITIISKKSCTIERAAKAGCSNGHAMIAYEETNFACLDGIPSLTLADIKYAHICQRTEEDKKDGLYDDMRWYEARVDLLEENKRLGSKNKGVVERQQKFQKGIESRGPTWIIPAEKAQRMLNAVMVAERDGHYVNFSMASDATSSSLAIAPVLPIGYVMGTGTTLAGAFSYYTMQAATTVGAAGGAEAVGASIAVGGVVAGSIGAVGLGLLAGKNLCNRLVNWRQGRDEEEQTLKNCAGWVRNQLKIAGINISIPLVNFRPKDMINYLNSNEESVQFA